MSAALQVILYLVAHKDEIKQLVASLESLAADIPGSQKAQAVKSYIAIALSVESQIEAAWPMVAPFFNLFVASVKKPA
jgi:hypothetical protein